MDYFALLAPFPPLSPPVMDYFALLAHFPPLSPPPPPPPPPPVMNYFSLLAPFPPHPPPPVMDYFAPLAHFPPPPVMDYFSLLAPFPPHPPPPPVMDNFALLAPLPSPPRPSPPPILVDYFALPQAEAKIQAQYKVMDNWSSSNEPRHLPKKMRNQPVLPSNVFPTHDPTVESHGLRPLLPAPMALSSCLADMQQQERQRLQLVWLEHERINNRWHSKSQSASPYTSHQGSNSNESLTSSATSRLRPKNKYVIQTPPHLNLKLVIQKVLKMSDIDSHGRIVIPKKEAEDKLPYLHEKVPMNIQMRDVFTGKIWDIKFRLWPNNGSKFYVLENTGEYIAKYKLTGGDLFALFEDTRWNYYIGCKKLTTPRVPRGQALVVEDEEGKWQGSVKDLVCHSDDEEFIAETSVTLKKFLEVCGDKGQSPFNAQEDGAGTSRGVAGMNLETSAVQNDTMVIDEPMIDLDYLNAKQVDDFHFSDSALEDFLDDLLRE